MCRVLESIISKQLICYLKSNNIFTKNQYAFNGWKINRIKINKMF